MSYSNNASSDSFQRPSLSEELDEALGPEDAGAVQVTAFLVGLVGRNAGKLFKIPAGESILGRSSKAFVTLDEKGVSHQHAKVTLSTSGCIIEDLDSTNGTRINDVRITEPQELHAGDVIRLGHANLGFLTDADDEQQHTRALARVTNPNLGLGAGATGAPSPGQRTTHDVGAIAPYATATGASIPPGGAIVSAPMDAPSGELIPAEVQYVEGPPPATQKLDDLLDKLDLALTFLRRYAWLLVFMFLGCATLAAATVAIAPPRATAEVQVFLRSDELPTAARNFVSTSAGFFEFAPKDFLNEELVEKSLKDMKMPTDPGMVRGARALLALEQVGRLRIFKGTFVHPDKDFAEKFLAAHLKNFLEFEIGTAIAVKVDELRLLQDNYNEVHERLLQAEGELRDFKRDNLGSLPQYANQELGAKGALVARRDGLHANLDRLSRELALARKQLSSKSIFIGAAVQRSAPYDQALSDVRKRIAATKSQGFADDHPEMVSLREEEKGYLELKKQTLNTEVTEIEKESNAEYRTLTKQVESLEVSIASTRTELEMVHGRLAELDEISEDMPGVEAEVAEKMRQVQGSMRLHDKLYEQLKAKELELEIERANVAARYEVISNPKASKPSAVRTAGMRAGIGGFVGLFLGLVIAIVHWLVHYAKRRNVRVNPPGTTTTDHQLGA